MHLSDIVFPVYSITDSYKRIWEDTNVTYIKTQSGKYVLDNRNIEGDTLGKRRLKINNSDLYKPRKSFYTLSQLIKSRHKTFIDSTGHVFSWKKTKNVPLKYHKVKEVYHDDEYCILHLKDIDFPQRIVCSMAYEIQYVGVLHTDEGYILYSFNSEFKKDTWRKI